MPKKNSLVLYKNRPARVLSEGDKMDVQLEDGSTKKLRPKDVELIHPGPINSLGELKPQEGDTETAWELLAGETTTLEELCELMFEAFSPAHAWTAYQLVAEGIYFRGTPDNITVATEEEVAEKKARLEAQATEKQARADFLARVKKNAVTPEDYPRLKEVEVVAMGKNVKSPLLKELGISATPEKAHALLLRLGRWDEMKNPHPFRFEMTLRVPDFPLPPLPEEERMDLTHLAAFAIDDEGSEDPDDAISFDGERVWVHIADAAALVAPASQADLEARKIAANLYLPETKVPMLPKEATKVLGLGLQDVSPALSFGLVLSETGEITDTQLTLSWVKVTRLTYAEATDRLEEEPFKTMYAMARTFQSRRVTNGAVMMDLPEVKLRVKEGKVHITPLPPVKGRELVSEFMFMAGEAAARFALENKMPFPFTNQDLPDDPIENPAPEDMAAMFALRFKMKRSQMQTVAKPHAGLGLEVYTRVTSPLRRYLDLVVHQQLRAFLKGEPLLDEPGLMLRVGAAEAVIHNVSRAERFSNKHWTLVYLKQNPQWEGEGVLVEKSDRRTLVMIPELELDVPIHLTKSFELNDRFTLSVSGIDIPTSTVHFKIKG